MPTVLRFIERYLPSPADKPPSGANWIHEIKHDGYRLMARRDPVGIRLLTRRGNDWANRFPLVVEAVNHLKVRSCLIDGEVVCCDERGLAAFHVLRENEASAFLYAFDLLELNGTDMRCEIEALITDIKTARTERNELLHCLWGKGEDDATAKIGSLRVHRPQKIKKKTASEVYAVADRLLNATKTLIRLNDEVQCLVDSESCSTT